MEQMLDNTVDHKFLLQLIATIVVAWVCSSAGKNESRSLIDALVKSGP